MSGWKRAWYGLQTLSWAERLLLLRAWWLLPLLAVELRLRGFRAVRARWLPKGVVASGREDLRAARATARIVRIASSWNPFPSRCLVRSLVLCRLLDRQGLSAELHIGVSFSEGAFEAHAWVEHAGEALAEAGDVRQRYAAFEKICIADPW